MVPEDVMSEDEAHELWDHLRERGEWFRATPELRAWADALNDMWVTSDIERATDE